MAEAGNGHSTPKSAVAVAIMAIHVAPPLGLLVPQILLPQTLSVPEDRLRGILTLH